MKPISIGGQQTEFTTAPVSATPAYVVGKDRFGGLILAKEPEFLDARGVEARFSIRRSLLYELHNSGDIQSVSLRRRGRSRGKRLFSVDSIRAFLRKQMENGGTE
jgi:hypothetical protein